MGNYKKQALNYIKKHRSFLQLCIETLLVTYSFDGNFINMLFLLS